jgi:hypothetical protein
MGAPWDNYGTPRGLWAVGRVKHRQLCVLTFVLTGVLFSLSESDGLRQERERK